MDTFVADVDASSADNVFNTRAISPRRCRLHSPYVASNKTVSSCRTYVLLQSGWISSSRVLVLTPRFLETTVQISVSLCLVVFVLRECRIHCVRRICRGTSAFWTKGPHQASSFWAATNLSKWSIALAPSCCARWICLDNWQLQMLSGRRRSLSCLFDDWRPR